MTRTDQLINSALRIARELNASWAASYAAPHNNANDYVICEVTNCVPTFYIYENRITKVSRRKISATRALELCALVPASRWNLISF